MKGQLFSVVIAQLEVNLYIWVQIQIRAPTENACKQHRLLTARPLILTFFTYELVSLISAAVKQKANRVSMQVNLRNDVANKECF